MNKIKVELEKWSSSKCREDHYYITNSNEYLCGFNPRYFTKKEVKEILSKVKKKSLRK